jgi:hypothetical protein
VSVTSLFATYLAPSIAKFLFKRYLGISGEIGGAALVDLAKDKIKDAFLGRKAVRDAEELADHVLTKLLPTLQEDDAASLDREAITKRLGAVLDGHVTAAYVLSADLKPDQLADQLRQLARKQPTPLPPPEAAVFDRALEQAARYLVETAVALPKFDEAAEARTVELLGEAIPNIEQILAKVHRIETRTAALGGDDTSLRYEKDYREAVLRNLDWVELFGVDVPDEYKRNQLTDAFVSLDVEQEREGKPWEGGADEDEEADESETLKCGVLLDRMRPGCGRLLIRGAAGSGKTTLMRWIAINAAPFTEQAESRRERRIHQMLPPPSPDEVRDLRLLSDEEIRNLDDLWRNRVPFLILLRHCKGGQLPKPDDFPQAIATEVGSPPVDWVKSVLADGRGLILLDGVDEVPKLDRGELFKRLKGLAEAYSEGNYLIVTTRPEAVEPDWLAPLGFREAAISPMGLPDVACFIDRWHDAFAKTLQGRGKSQAGLKEVAKQLKADVRNEPSVALLAANPLLCGMICALNHYRREQLPKSLPSLCKALFEMLLYRRDEEQKLDVASIVPEYHKLEPRRKVAILKHLAVFFVEQGRSAFEEDRLVGQVKTQLELFPGNDPTKAREVLRGFVERSGLLREAKAATADGAATIEFLHNTFKEYLAGEYYATNDRIETLLSHLDDEVWQRVALFAVGTDQDPAFASRVIEKLLGAEDRTARPVVFALRCRAMATYLKPELVRGLDQRAKALFPPKTMAQARDLAACGEVVLPHLAYHRGLKATEAKACVRTLALLGTERAMQRLADYAVDRRQTVSDEIVRIASKNQAFTLVGRLTHVTTLDLSNTKVSDLSPLAGLTKLSTLNLSNTQVSDLSPLAGLTELAEIGLSGTQVSDLSPLAGLTTLSTLYLDGTQVSDLSPLAGLTTLSTLNLSNTQASDLSPLAGLTKLSTLNLSNTQASDLSPLAGLTELAVLGLSGTQVSDLSPLAGLTTLSTLYLDGTQVSDPSPLAGLTKLSIWSVGSTVGVATESSLNRSGRINER